MNEELKSIYDIMQQSNLLPKEVPFEAFSRKMSEEGELRKLYDGLSANGAVKGSWEQFESKVTPKKKEPTSEPLSPGSATSSSSPDAPVQTAGTPSVPEQAPWEQVISSTKEAAPGGPQQIDLTSPDAYRNIGQPRDGIGPFSQALTGDEDPIEYGEAVKSTLPNYEYKKVYEGKTTLRKMGRDMDNISVYGQQARKQTQAAEARLEEKFGRGWDSGLENMVTMMGQMKDDPAMAGQYNKILEQYNTVVSDPDFQEYQNGMKAQQKGYEQFMAYQERPEIKQKVARAAKAQTEADVLTYSGLPEMLAPSRIPGQPGGATNWAMRKGAQLLGGALSLPRTISGALPDSWTAKDFRFADEMASLGDELVESAGINYPKPTQLKRPLYEKTVEFEGKTVVVDGKGKFQEARDKEGNVIAGTNEAAEGEKSFEQRFADSDMAKNASIDFNGTVASTLDKTLDAAADLLIYRYLGRGTKPGVVASSMALGHQDAYREAIEAGMLPQDAAEYAFFSSLGVGALEAYIGNIETAFAKPGVAEAIRLGKKEALSLAGKASGAQKAWTALKPVLKQVGEENAEETAQGIYGDLTKAAYNQMTGAEMDMQSTKEGMAETALITTLVTAPAAMMGMGANANQYRMSALMAAVNNPDRFNSLMSEFVDNGVIDETQSAMLQAKIGQLAAYNANLPSTMQTDDRAHVLALQEYRDSQARIAESDRYVDAQRQTAREEVKKVDGIIGEIVAKSQGPAANEGTDTKPPVSVVNNVLATEPKAEVYQEEAKPPAITVEPSPLYEPMVTPQQLELLPPEIQPVVTGEVFNDPNATVEQLAIPATTETQPAIDATTDRITEAAIATLEEKGVTVTAETVPAVQAFVVPEMTDPNQINDPNEHPAAAIDRLTDEFIVENDLEPSKAPLPEQRKALLDQMDESLGEEGGRAFGQFSEALGNKFSAIHAAMTENTPEWQAFEKENPRAAGLAKAAFRKIATINEQIKLERETAVEPSPAGPVAGQTEAAQVENVLENAGNIEGREIKGGTIQADVQPGIAVEVAARISRAMESKLPGKTVAAKIGNGLIAVGNSASLISKAVERPTLKSNGVTYIAFIGTEIPAIVSEIGDSVYLGEDLGKLNVTQVKELSDLTAMERADAFKPVDISRSDVPGSDKASEIINKLAQTDTSGMSVKERVNLNSNALRDAASAIDGVLVENDYTQQKSSRTLIKGGKKGHPQYQTWDSKWEPTEKGDTSFEDLDGDSDVVSDYIRNKHKGRNILLVKTYFGSPESVQILRIDKDGNIVPSSKADATVEPDVVDRAEELSNQTPKSESDAVSMSKEADDLIAETPLPDKPDESNIAQLVANGSIEPETAALALSELPGAEAAGEEVMAAMDDIKKDMTDERADAVETGEYNDMATAHSPEEVHERPAFVETDTEFIVTRSTHIRDILRDMGGKWTPGRGWVFPLKMKEQVLAAIARPVNPPREVAEKGNPGLAGRLGAAMRDPNVYRLASQRRRRIAKGKSLEERLRIAQEEVRIAEDERLQRVQRTAERLQKAFPGVEIVTDPKEYAAAAKKAFPDAEVPPSGFASEGKVYYDIERAGVDTPIHEFGHIWNTLMATHFPAQHAAGLETMRGSEYEAAVREDARYAGLDDAEMLDEALALAIGERGARIMNASRWERFQAWLDDVWMSMKRLLKTDPFQFTAQQYADYAAAKLLSGKEVFPETTEEIARLEKQAKAMFVGEFSQMSDQARDDLDMARRMEERGHSNQDIWAATNWRRAVDGKWKFEISDKDARIVIMPALINTGEVWSLDEIMQHDSLFERYPNLKNMPVVFIHQPSANFIAAVATDNKTGGMTILINRDKVENLKSHLLHEIQHLVQKQEGFNYPIPVTDKQNEMIRRIQDLTFLTEMYEGEKKDQVVAELDNAVEEFRNYYIKQSAEVEARNVQFRQNFDDRGIRAVFPEKTEDVAKEEQKVFFGVENPKVETPGFAEEGELLEGTTPYARAHFGSEELRNAGIRNAAIQLIEIEITEGAVPRDQAIPQIAAGLGLDEAFVGQLWDEAVQRVGSGALKIDFRRPNDGIKKKIERWAKRQFSYKGLLPRDVFHDAQRMEQNISAINYMAEKQAKDLDKAINAYIKSRETRMNRLAQQEFRQLVNNVMNGNADWALLPDEVAVQARVLRNTIDRLSRELLMSGAFGPNAIVTVLENMGVVIDNSVDGAEFSVAISALSKPPYERTQEENLLVDAFLEKHQTQFGTYLNRSYRVHAYPDWRDRIPQDVWNRARRYYINQFVARRNELEQIVAKNDDKDAAKLERLKEERDQVKTLIGGIVDELEAKVDAIDTDTSFPRPPEGNIDLDDLGDTVESIRDFIGKIREELGRIGNIQNAEMVELDSMIGPNAQALSGYLRQMRSLNDEIAAVELKMERRVEDAARELDIINNNLANIDRFMRQELIEEAKSLDVLMTGGQLGAKPTSITKKRKNLPEEIRALYGEYQDPVINFSQSVMKMAQLLESQKFLNRLRSRYEGVYFFQDGKQSGDADTRIAAEGNARMAPMDGWYTTPDIAQAMTDFYGAENVAQWQRFWAMYVVNAIKLGKTILSPVTQARNFWGNVSFMVANGWNPYRMWQAWREYGDMWNKMEPGKWRQYAARLHELGVFGNSVNAKDIENLRNTLGFENAPKEDYGEFVENRIIRAGKAIKTAPKKTFEIAQKLYEAGDAFYKLMGFENEKRRYARAWFGRPFDELTPAQQAEVEEKAAMIVKSVLPTYSYVPRIVKTIRRLPFVGTFVAFPAEMIRVTYNGYALATEEMRDPRTRSFGVRRAMGYSLALSASWGLVQAFKALFGYDDEEWDDANKFVSEYQKNAMLLPLPKDKNGNMRYVNLSYTDPFSFLSKTINAGFDDPNQAPAGRAVNMFKEMTSPFLSPELSFWTFMQLAMNVDDRGQTIRKKAYEDEVFDSQYLAQENLKRQFDFARKKLQPGMVKSAWDAYDIANVNADKAGRIKEWQDFLLNHVFGLNIERIDPKVSYSFSMKALMSERNEARAGYTAVQGQLNRAWKSTQQKFDEMSEAEIAAKTKEFDSMATERLKAQYEVSKSAYLRILKDGHETTKALMRLGTSEAEVREILKEAKFGQKNNEINAIISGNYESVILTFKKKEKY